MTGRRRQSAVWREMQLDDLDWRLPHPSIEQLWRVREGKVLAASSERNQSGVGIPALRVDKRAGMTQVAAASQHLALLLARRCSFQSQAPRTVRPWEKTLHFQVMVSNDRTTRISSQTSLITLHPHHPSHPSAVACFLVDGSLRQYSHWVAQPRIPASRAVITRKVGMGVLYFWARCVTETHLRRAR
jgi:hypothetical protein